MDGVFGRIEALYLGVTGEHLVKQPRPILQAELDGFKGDRHGTFQRKKTIWFKKSYNRFNQR